MLKSFSDIWLLSASVQETAKIGIEVCVILVKIFSDVGGDKVSSCGF